MGERSEKAVRIPELDGIRGLACLLVLAWHYFGAPLSATAGTWQASVLGNLGAIGRSGVDLFFVLSGFLISGILFDHRASPTYFRTFITRRVCRIFPIYFLVFFGFLLVLRSDLPRMFPAMNEWLLKDCMPVWSYPTFTQNFFMAWERHAGGKFIGMTWSVAVEEQFYLLFPFIVYFVPMSILRYLILFAIVGAPVLRIVASQNHLWYYTLLPCRIDCLAVGVMASALIRNKAALEYLKQNRGMIYAVMGCLLLCMFYLSQQSLWFSWIALFYSCVVILVVVHTNTFAAGFCRLQRLRDLGLISYGVYMYHQPIQGLCHAMLLNQVPTLNGYLDLLVSLLALGLSLGVALLSYHCMEKWFLALGHKAKWWPKESIATHQDGLSSDVNGKLRQAG